MFLVELQEGRGGLAGLVTLYCHASTHCILDLMDVVFPVVAHGESG